MKLYFLIFASALSVGTLASKADHMNAHEVKDLVARSIDPKTMDPTRLSVLLVLKTAIPSGPEFPQPTGDIKPDWYQKLPEDVKSLLPSLYPVPSKTSSARSSSATASPSVPTSSFVSTSDLSPSEVSTAVPASLSPPTWTSQLPFTKTLQNAPSTTVGYQVPTNGSITAPAPTNGTVAAAFPLPSEYTSIGTQTAMRMETLATLAWVGLGAGLLFFA